MCAAENASLRKCPARAMHRRKCVNCTHRKDTIATACPVWCYVVLDKCRHHHGMVPPPLRWVQALVHLHHNETVEIPASQKVGKIHICRKAQAGKYIYACHMRDSLLHNTGQAVQRRIATQHNV